MNETVKIYYAIDDGNYTEMQTVAGASQPITSAGRHVLEFQPANITATETVSRGLAFERIRFRIDMARGSDVTLSPVIRAVNLHFLKVPQSSTTLQFAIPLPKRLYRTRGGQQIDAALNYFAEADEMVFVRHREELFRMRIAQISGNDETGQDYSGIRTLRLVEIPTNADL